MRSIRESLLWCAIFAAAVGAPLTSESDEALEEDEWICHGGWTLFKSDDEKVKYCFRVFVSFRLTWQQAEESCSNYGNGHLVSLHTDDEVKAVNEAIEEERNDAKLATWISSITQRTPHSGWWVGLGELCPRQTPTEKPQMRWTDGSIGEQSYALQMPSKYNPSKHYCVAYQKDSVGDEMVFNVTDCSQLRNFICKVPSFKQKKNRDGLVLDEEKEEDQEMDNSDLSDQYVCGKDPLTCAMRNGEDGVKCVRLLTKLMPWQHADRGCEAQLGASLASIHSRDEEQFIYEMINMQPTISGETKYWMGLHRRNAYREYEWSDGTPLNYIGINSPNGDDNGWCGAMKLNVSSRKLLDRAYQRADSPSDPPSPAVSWTHERCDSLLLSICEKPGYGDAQDGEESSEKEKQKAKEVPWKCPENYYAFRGMCYRVFGKDESERKTFPDAKKACEKDDAVLVSLTDYYEQAFVLSLLQGGDDNAWIGMDMSEGRVRWLDGEPIHITKFSPDIRIAKVGPSKHVFQNNLLVGFVQDACVSIDVTSQIGYWDLTLNFSESLMRMKGNEALKDSPQCHTTKLPFVCEKYAVKDTDDTVERRPCYTTQKGDVTYCFVSNDDDPLSNNRYTFEEGDKRCGALFTEDEYQDLEMSYGQIAQADDIFEWSLLTTMAFQNRYEDFYIGVRYKNGFGFERSDGQRVRLAPWGDGEPNLANGECVAVKIANNEASWYMVPCTRKKQLVCRLTKEEPLAEIPPSNRCPKGKEDWILGKTQCYKLVTDASLITSQPRADFDCFKFFQANLASFETKEDFDEFKRMKYVDDISAPYAFIGLIRQIGGSFAWKDGSPVTFLNWGPSQPPAHSSKDSEECVQVKLSDDFEWRTVACYQNRHYICSTPAIPTNPNRDDDEDEDEDVPELPSEGETNQQADDNKVEITSENIVNGEESNKKTKGSSAWGPVLASIFGLTIVAGLIVIYLRRRRKQSIEREQIIMRFDDLQNEDEFDK